MGKALVEKLLRSCPGVDIIYLLIRSSAGKDAACRLNELVANEVGHILFFSWSISRKEPFDLMLLLSILKLTGFRYYQKRSTGST